MVPWRTNPYKKHVPHKARKVGSKKLSFPTDAQVRAYIIRLLRAQKDPKTRRRFPRLK